MPELLTKAAYARQCLVARRLVERGVRFVELTMIRGHGDGTMANPWDQLAVRTDLAGPSIHEGDPMRVPKLRRAQTGSWSLYVR